MLKTKVVLFVLASVLTIGVFAVARDAFQADAATGPIPVMAVDALSDASNTGTTIGTIEECTQISGVVGTTHTIDVLLDDIPSGTGNNFSGGSFDLVYNPAIIKINSYTTPKIPAAFTTFGDPVPDTDGDYRAESAIFSAYPSGDGVWYRFVVEVVGTGVTNLDLTDNLEFDGLPNPLDETGTVYDITTLSDGRLAVGTTCPAATPTPTPAPTTAEVIVHKDFSDNNTADVTITLLCTGNPTQTNVDNTASEADPANFTVDMTGGPTICTATESVPAGYSANQAGCAGFNLNTGGQEFNCTIVNSTTTTFTVSKDYQPDNLDAVNVHLVCTSGIVSPPGANNSGTDTASEGGGPAEFTVTGFNTGATCTVSESDQLPGYALSTNCVGANLQLTPGGNNSCELSNIVTTTLTVSKDFSDDNAMDVTINTPVCTSGSVTTIIDSLASESDPAEFVIAGFSAGATCDVTEVEPDGYVGDDSGCQDVALVVGDATAACTMVNTLTSATINVSKNFTDDSPGEVTVGLTCGGTNTIIAIDDATATETPVDDDATFTITGFPAAGTTCTATETVVPPGYAESANVCVDITITPGSTTGCTITNAPSTGTVTITKDYIPDLSSPDPVDVVLACTSGNIVDNTLEADEGSPAVFTVNAFNNGATCTANEFAAAPGYEMGGNCVTPALALVNGGNVSCGFVNQSYAQLHVAKDFSDNSTANVNVTVFGCNSGTVTTVDGTASEADPADFEIRGFSPDASCTVTESTPSGYSFSRDSVCNNFDPTPGGDVTCTITNYLNTFSVTVEKDYIGGGAEPQVTITLTCQSGTVTPPTAPAGDPSPDAFFTVTGIEFGDTCTATEAAPAGYTANQTACAGMMFLPDPSGADSTSCTITNTLNTASVNVAKDFTDNNSSTVTVGLTCTSGTVTTVDGDASEADDANFTVAGHNAGATCTASETGVPAGYSQSGNTCNPSAAISTTGGTTSCTITNANQITYTVNKDFSDNNAASVQVTFSCESGTITPPGGTPRTLTEAAPIQYVITDFTGTPTCTATESPVPAGYSTMGNCSSVITTTPNCTIVNTLRTNDIYIDKDFSDDNPAAVTMSVSCNSGTVTVVDATATDNGVLDQASAAHFTVTGFDAGVACVGSETVPQGYALTNGCTSLAPIHGGQGTCMMTNTLNSAVLTVDKDFSDNNPQDMDIDVTCTSGTVVEGDGTASESDNANYSITGFNSAGTTCNATEPNPGIYTPDLTNCTGVAISHGAGANCTIFNSSIIQWTVRKVWMPVKATSVVVTLTCTSGTVTVQDMTANNVDPADFTVTGASAGTTCTATENATPGYTQNVTDCANQPVQRGTCTILNGQGGFPTFTSSPTPVPVTNTPSPTPTASPTPSPTATPGSTTPGETDTPSPSPTASPTKRPTRTPIGGAPSVTATPTPTFTPTPSPTNTPIVSLTNTPTPGPTQRPTRTPVPGLQSASSGLKALGSLW